MPPAIDGAFARHPVARSFANEVQRVHRRYAMEVVAAFRLCPFVRGEESALEAAFGRFCVVLDRGLDVERTCRLVDSAQCAVVHVVFPCIDVAPAPFEKFASAVGEALRRGASKAPVLAAFHPGLTGDLSAPHRLIGLLRRAPDPFVQFIPEGLHEGGTTFAGALSNAQIAELAARCDPAKETFDRLRGKEIERLLAVLDDIHADRARSYAPFLAELCCEQRPTGG